MNNDEIEDAERRLMELAAAGARLDPPAPTAFDDAAAAFAWRSIDAELADLVFDSALHGPDLVGVRSPQTARQLTFEAPTLTVELEFDRAADCPLAGQLVPPGPAEIEICSLTSSTVVQADQWGRFRVRDFSGHLVSLRIGRPAGDVEWVTTPWVSLSPSAQSPSGS